MLDGGHPIRKAQRDSEQGFLFRNGSICMLEKIAHVDLFDGLSQRALHEVLLSASPVQRFAAEQYLFWQGAPATAIFVLLTGQAHLIVLDRAGHELVVRVIEPGYALGITALIPGERYSTSALIVQESHVLGWSGDVLRELANRYPRLWENALRLAIERYADLQQAYQRLAFERVDQRLAKALLSLVRSQPRAEDGALVVREPRKRLAALAVTTIYTVSRLLNEWEQKGIIALRSGDIVLTDLGALDRIASERS